MRALLALGLLLARAPVAAQEVSSPPFLGEVLRLDLAAVFDLTSPGSYRLQVHLDAAQGAPATGSTRTLLLEVRGP